jgi:heat shock protein HtpX
MRAVGLQTHIWANNTRTTLLLIGFPIMLLVILFGLVLVLVGLSGESGDGSTLGDSFEVAWFLMGYAAPAALIAAGLWFVIAFFFNQTMVDAMTGARAVERRDAPDLYNLLENLAISRGMKTPTLRIVESESLNAFASGIREGQYSVSVTRGLMGALDRDEMEAVLAHELTHVINKDVRTMVVASIFAGIITVLCELMFRGMLHSRPGKDSKNSLPLILIGLAIAAVGYLLAIVIRLMLSRTREYVADAGAVELTKNPDAMISALRKVSGRSNLPAPDDMQGMFLDNEKTGFIDSLFATHPPIEKRIEALIKFGGGEDPGPWDAAPSLGQNGQSVPVTGSTSVPST